MNKHDISQLILNMMEHILELEERIKLLESEL